MDNSEQTRVTDEFQLAFSKVCQSQIQRVIQESREEAFAEAKQILRDQSLNSVLAAAVDHADGKQQSPSDSSKRLRNRHVQKKAETIQKLEKKKNGLPALNDRILQEIEAIREQIMRNEQLLSQIKPMVRSVKISKE